MEGLKNCFSTKIHNLCTIREYCIYRSGCLRDYRAKRSVIWQHIANLGYYLRMFLLYLFDCGAANPDHLRFELAAKTQVYLFLPLLSRDVS